MSRNSFIISTFVLFLLLNNCGRELPSNTSERSASKISEIDITPLIGDWQIEAGAEFKEITIDNEGVFFTYLNARPFETGTWKRLKNGTLLFKGEYESEFIITAVKNDTSAVVLTLKSGEVMVLKKPEPGKTDDLQANIEAFFNGAIKYTGLDDKGMNEETDQWYDGEELQDINGYSTILISEELTSDATHSAKMKMIYEYFRGLDFKGDGFNTTELFDGMTDGKYVMKIYIINNVNGRSIKLWGGRL